LPVPESHPGHRRIGLWLVGAKGGVATTLLVGLAALQRRAIEPIGLLTELEPFSSLDLVDFPDIVVGGHDIRSGRLVDEARRMWTDSRAIAPELIDAAADFLVTVEGRLRPGTVLASGERIRELADYVNFTPSTGATPACLQRVARDRGIAHAGCDGKTGETLLKSVLAPMFAARHLRVMSWVGHNIFGNMDGRVLDDPRNKAAKVRSKDHLLAAILGYPPQTHVSIEYIQSLGDWKTAWDHIHFQGFLGTTMTMQFTWQGCDSILAAPLVLDLVRLVERAARAGETGALEWLACFFKSPIGVAEQAFAAQVALLDDWARRQS
jgi:hypothetical protein